MNNAFNPEENVRAGVGVPPSAAEPLREQRRTGARRLQRPARTPSTSTAETAVPPYAETRNYVSRINGISTPPIERRASNVIYKVTEIVDGREVVRSTDKRPAKGSYRVIGR